jgi:ribose-phosphate pyrophosphokinase
MILFALPFFEDLARDLAGVADLERGLCSIARFPNDEIHVELATTPAGQDCVVLGSIAPPDERMLSTLLLSHTLKKEGARKVTALLPYLGYARQDREEPRKSLATAWAGELLRASGADEVVAVDVHSGSAHRLFPIPLRSLPPAEIFAREITARSLAGATIVAPDEGARGRCEAVREAVGAGPPLAYLEKTRTPDGVMHSALHGEVGARAVVVDDILDTGGTLVSACEALGHAGVREITIMVTHGLFTGSLWERLWSLGVTRICCTDTVPLPPRLGSATVAVLSVAPLLRADLRRQAKGAG